ncbi:MAG: hypothetical protein V2I33_13325 [Kangiellaceae bacterium]|jgi:KDO2-lipid IV(A) lauroyltransferase|nr:hypothetical protein [Kangiellaceae bacterium]
MKSLIVSIFSLCVSYLPLNVNRFLGRVLGRTIYHLKTRTVTTTITNLDYTNFVPDQKSRKSLVKESCIQTGMTLTESFWLWNNSSEKVLAKVISVRGAELIDEALADSNGVLMIGCHYGAWELFTIWCAVNYPLIAAYRPAKIAALEDIMQAGRSKTGAEFVSGERKNVRQILKRLKDGSIFAILADQEPALGSGIYANFLNKPAYSMTLPFKLAIKTNAKPLFFSITRIEDGFTIEIEEVPRLAQQPMDKFVQEMNNKIESIIKRVPAQFEWGYKRFKTLKGDNKDIYSK